MSWWLLLAVALITLGSRIAAVALLPPPRGEAAAIVQRLPAPLFAGLAALSVVSADGEVADPAILAAAGCAVLAGLRWPSLLVTLAAGLGGFVVAGLI